MQPGDAESQGMFFHLDHARFFEDFCKLSGGREVHDGIGQVGVGGGIFGKDFCKRGQQKIQIDIVDPFEKTVLDRKSVV